MFRKHIQGDSSQNCSRAGFERDRRRRTFHSGRRQLLVARINPHQEDFRARSRLANWKAGRRRRPPRRQWRPSHRLDQLR